MGQYFAYFGSPLNTTRKWTEIDGERHVIYCLEHKNPIGPGAGVRYEVTIVSETDSMVYSILERGFPKRSAVDLGLNNDDDAYYVTRMALAMYTDYQDINAWMATSGTTNGRTYDYKQQMLSVAKDIAQMGRFMPTAEELERAEVSDEEIEAYKEIVLQAGDTLVVTDIQAKTLAVIERNLSFENRRSRMSPQPRSDGIVWYEAVPSGGQQPVAIRVYKTTPPDFDQGQLRIIKTDDQGNRLAGAVFEITGPDFMEVVTINSTGEWISGEEPDLTLGTYTITELTPPPGYELATPTTQTVEVKSNQAIEEAMVTFINTKTPNPTPTPPPAPTSVGVKIQKIDALTRQNIPGALVRLRGMSSHQIVTGDGQLWEIDNTGINISQVLTQGATTAVPGGVTSTVTNGVWTLQGLPYGHYQADEERAPNNYSLLPQHTSYSFWVRLDRA